MEPRKFKPPLSFQRRLFNYQKEEYQWHISTTPEGKHYEAERATVRELLDQWHLKKAIGMTVGGEVVDCDRVFTEDTEFAPLFPDCEQGLDLLRHSTAHLLAHAVLRLWPEAKFGIGPAIKDGFYYDIRFPQPISDEDLPKIEAEMRRISQEKIPLVRGELSKDEAVKKFAAMGEDLKVELIEGIEGETLSTYTEGDFTDFCRGPHVPAHRLLQILL